MGVIYSSSKKRPILTNAHKIAVPSINDIKENYPFDNDQTDYDRLTMINRLGMATVNHC